MLTFRPDELRAFNAKLGEMSKKLGKQAVRQAAREAMKPVRDEVKRNAPFDPTDDGIHIAKNVALKTSWRGSTLTASVGIRGGAKANLETPWYFRMQEFGTKHMPARPFILPALEGQAQDVLNRLTASLKKALFP